MSLSISNPYRPGGRWWRANLHTHTTASDGALAPDLVCAKYREAGYHILAITDHERLTPCGCQPEADFLTIPGTEVGWPNVLHLGARKVVQGGTLPETLEAIQREGGLAVIAHPFSTTAESLLAVEGYQAIEIVNFFCLMHHEFGPEASPAGEALGLWDDLLRAGRRVWGIASDDAHFKDVPDFAGAWVWVQAEELTEVEVLRAIEAGRFYASEGPQVHEVTVEQDGSLHVRSTPVAEVRLVTDDSEATHTRRSDRGEDESFSVSLEGLGLMKPGYVRVELRDVQGRRAWLNPVFID